MSLRLRYRLVALLITIFVLSVGSLSAQPATVTFTPASPTATNVITARISYQGLPCAFVPTTTVTGSTVRMDVAIFGCQTGPPSGPITQFVPFGPLPAGTYTYELYFIYDSAPPLLQVQQPLVVSPAAAAPIPALRTELLLLLTIVLGMTAVISLRRF